MLFLTSSICRGQIFLKSAAPEMKKNWPMQQTNLIILNFKLFMKKMNSQRPVLAFFNIITYHHVKQTVNNTLYPDL